MPRPKLSGFTEGPWIRHINSLSLDFFLYQMGLLFIQQDFLMVLNKIMI